MLPREKGAEPRPCCLFTGAFTELGAGQHSSCHGSPIEALTVSPSAIATMEEPNGQAVIESGGLETMSMMYAERPMIFLRSRCSLGIHLAEVSSRSSQQKAAILGWFFSRQVQWVAQTAPYFDSSGASLAQCCGHL